MRAIKIRIDIVVDRTVLGPRGGDRFLLNRWVFEKNTGRTVAHDIGINRGMTLKDARSRKREIMEEFRG